MVRRSGTAPARLILVSAGFDAHQLDPLAALNLQEQDFQWITQQIVSIANRYSQGRVVSTLEGGYDLEALAVPPKPILRRSYNGLENRGHQSSSELLGHGGCYVNASLGRCRYRPYRHTLELHAELSGLPRRYGRGLNDIPAMADFVGSFQRRWRTCLSRTGARLSQFPLSDQDLADVLNWILLTMSAAQLPHPFIPYSAKEVAGFRQQPLADAAATRARLLEKFTGNSSPSH